MSLKADTKKIINYYFPRLVFFAESRYDKDAGVKCATETAGSTRSRYFRVENEMYFGTCL